MIVRHFLGWVRTAPAGERAEATRALARACLFSDMSSDDFAATEGALLMLLDDPSPLVREAMAEVFARTADAPPAIVRALSTDQASVALPILEHSPLLIDADLVDIVATGSPEIQCAVARRIDAADAGLCGNRRGRLGRRLPGADRQSGRATCADFARPHRRAVRPHRRRSARSLLDSHELPAATRLALVGKLSGALVEFRHRAQLAQRRARGDGRQFEACERSTVNIAATSRGRRSARAGPSPARDRPADRGIDPASAVVGQHRHVRICACRADRHDRGEGGRDPARAGRLRRDGAADARGFSAIDVRRVPRGAVGHRRNRLHRHRRWRGAAAPADGRARADELRAGCRARRRRC